MSSIPTFAALCFAIYCVPCVAEISVQSSFSEMPSIAKMQKNIGGTGLLHAVQRAHIQSLQKQHVHLPQETSWYAKLPHFTWTPLLGVYEKYMLRSLPKKEIQPLTVFLNHLNTKTIIDDNIELYLSLIKKLTAKKERENVPQKEKEQLEREITSYKNRLTITVGQRLDELQDKKWNETVQQHKERLTQLQQELEHQINVYQKSNTNTMALERLKLLRDAYNQWHKK